jgi:type IV fimbrial biogenesis protein FimT
MHSQRAFTLIEASVVLFIIGILMTLSLPMLKSFIERTDDELMQAQLLRAMALARFETRIRQMPVTLCKSKDHKHCSGEWKDGWIVFVDPNKEGVVKRKEQILAVMQSAARYGKLYWRSFPVYRDYLLFLPNWAFSDNGTFWYCHHSALAPAWAIVMNQFGRARTVYPDQQGEIRVNNGKPLRCDE